MTRLLISEPIARPDDRDRGQDAVGQDVPVDDASFGEPAGAGGDGERLRAGVLEAGVQVTEEQRGQRQGERDGREHQMLEIRCGARR